MYSTRQLERKLEPYLPQTYTSCIKVLCHSQDYACQDLSWITTGIFLYHISDDALKSPEKENMVYYNTR